MVWTGTSNCHRFQILSLSPRGHVAKKEQTMQGRVYRLWSMKWSKKLFTCCFSAKYDQNAKNGARTSKGQIPTKNKNNLSPVALYPALFQIGFRTLGNIPSIFERHLSKKLQFILIPTPRVQWPLNRSFPSEHPPSSHHPRPQNYLLMITIN